jgi:transposase
MNSNPSLHDTNNSTQNATRSNRQSAPAPGAHTYKLGLDVDLRNVVVATQCDRGAIKHAQKLSRPQLIAWVKEQTAAGHTVHTVYECCGFGYTLHEELTAAGAQSLVTTPMRLNLERRRKNDRMDATELCVRLSRYLDGHRLELRPIRIPSRAEQNMKGKVVLTRQEISLTWLKT